MQKKQNKDIHKICLRPSATLKDAFGVLGSHPALDGLVPGIVIITDAKLVVKGIITHGDISRALTEGGSLEDSVQQYMNTSPFLVQNPSSNNEIIGTIVETVRKEQWHKNRLEKIIIVDDKNVLIDVVNFFDIWQGSDVRFKRIGIVGLGFVGLTLGVTLADLGYDVFASDINAKVLATVKRKKSPFFEEGLEALLEQHVDKNFHLTKDFTGNNGCDAYFIAVGTPLSKNNVPNLEYIREAARSLGEVLKKNDLIILRSTVPIGTTRNVVVPELEKTSGLVAGEDFFVAFAPERTVEGKALSELRSLPQVVGGINKVSADLAASIFNLMTNSIYVVDSLEEAEVVKLINNSYRDVTFGFANEVSMICQKWGIDTNTVIDAANMGYARSNVPKPSPGVGGYCLVKDPHIFMEGGEKKGYQSTLIKGARQANVKVLGQLGKDIVRHLKKKDTDQKVFVLGFAFKGNPPTSDLRGSSTVELVAGLQKAGFTNIHGYDPMITNAELRALDVKPTSLSAGFKNADAVVIMNNHPDFASLDILPLLAKTKAGALFFDTWSLFDRNLLSEVDGVEHRRL